MGGKKFHSYKLYQVQFFRSWFSHLLKKTNFNLIHLNISKVYYNQLTFTCMAATSPNQLMVTCWFLSRWFGFLESLKMKGIVTWVYPDSNPKPPGPKPTITPSKFNIAPEKLPSQQKSTVPTIIFQGLC